MNDTHFLCQIRAEAESDEAEILVYDDIGASWFGEGIAAKQFIKDLAALDASLITVRINSAGGDVFEGLAIHNALKRHDAMVVVEIDALAASIAGIIALAGDEVRMADNAFFMVHEPSGLEWGTAEDMRVMAELLDKVGGSLANVYATKTGKGLDEVRAWMAAETWFDADEAAEVGLVDVVTEGKKMAARANLDEFENTPQALRAALAAQAKKPEQPKSRDNPVAAGGAAPIDSPAPTQPAPAAKGDTVENNTAAQKTGADNERERSKAIRALIREYGEIVAVAADTVDGWLDDPDMSEDIVRAELLKLVKASAKEAPKVKATVGAPRADNDPKRGFENHREFFLSVIENRKASSKDDVKEERLRPLAIFDEDDDAGEMAFLMPRAFNTRSIRAAAGSDEQGTYADPYGGFAVPESTLPGMLSVPFEGDPTIGRTQSVPMATPHVKILARTDKDHTTSVSGGFTVTRRPETINFTSSRSKMERVTLEASSLVGLAYETEELLTDSAISFAALIEAGFRDQFAAHILNEKIRGDGVGEYEGILNAAAKVEIAKESGQDADTINYTNVLKMRAQSWGYGNAIWLANHDTLPQLAQMALAVGTGGAPVYMPGGFGDRPEMLLGRPIFYSEYMATLGDAGDIVLWNPTQYLEGVYQPLRSAESVHVRFVQHERVFKLWLRNAGASWWRAALTPNKSSSKLSPIVTLAARA